MAATVVVVRPAPDRTTATAVGTLVGQPVIMESAVAAASPVSGRPVAVAVGMGVTKEETKAQQWAVAVIVLGAVGVFCAWPRLLRFQMSALPVLASPPCSYAPKRL